MQVFSPFLINDITHFLTPKGKPIITAQQKFINKCQESWVEGCSIPNILKKLLAQNIISHTISSSYSHTFLPQLLACFLLHLLLLGHTPIHDWISLHQQWFLTTNMQRYPRHQVYPQEMVHLSFTGQDSIESITRAIITPSCHRVPILLLIPPESI